MCFYADSAEVRLDGELARLVFHVDGDAVAQVALRTRDLDSVVSEYLRLRELRDGRSMNVVAFPRHAADSA